jgi:hypothetical protein
LKKCQASFLSFIGIAIVHGDEVPHTTCHNRPKLVRMRKNSITVVEGITHLCVNPSFSLDLEALSVSLCFPSTSKFLGAFRKQKRNINQKQREKYKPKFSRSIERKNKKIKNKKKGKNLEKQILQNSKKKKKNPT